MSVVFDKLLGQVLLHNHKTWYMVSPDGNIWDITINNSGVIISTSRGAPPAGNIGQPMGLLLSLTYNA